MDELDRYIMALIETPAKKAKLETLAMTPAESPKQMDVPNNSPTKYIDGKPSSASDQINTDEMGGYDMFLGEELRLKCDDDKDWALGDNSNLAFPHNNVGSSLEDLPNAGDVLFGVETFEQSGLSGPVIVSRVPSRKPAGFEKVEVSRRRPRKLPCTGASHRKRSNNRATK